MVSQSARNGPRFVAVNWARMFQPKPRLTPGPNDSCLSR